jgi:phage terminase large subunit
LHITHEAGGVGVEIRNTAALYRTVPDADSHIIRADSARPETISHLRNEGLNVVGVEKWPNSVEEGIRILNNFNTIKIHPRCVNLLKEVYSYRYKVDRLTGDVLPVIVDANNHYWDAVRYALAPLIKASLRPKMIAVAEGNW